MPSQAEIDAMLARMTPEQMADMLVLMDELEARKRIQMAQNDFLAFIAAVDPTYKFGVHLKRLGGLLMDVEAAVKDRIAVSMAPRFGKLLADDTPVWTPQGWRNHGDLQPGDWVYHPSGQPVQVIAVSEPGPANMRVETTDGAVLYCHERHEWAVRKRNNGGTNEYRVLETQALAAAKLGTGVLGGRGGRYTYQLPERSACQAPQRELPMHPYALGAWLGDGVTSKPCITHSSDDQPYVDRVAACGYPISAVHVHKDTGVLTTAFSVGGKGRGNGSKMLYDLRAAGVLGNKHIPTAYLTASVSQRLELLAGLIDTDGTRDKTGRYSFTTVQKRLADDVVTLVRSLGWRAGVVEVQPRLSSSGIQGTRPYYMVSFNASYAIPVALGRKAFLKAPIPRSVAVKSVVYDPQGKVGRCIQVSAEDGLYMAGEHMTPTHNSQMISIYYPAWYLGKHPDHKVIVASHTADLAVDMLRKVRNLMQTQEYRRIFPEVAISADAKAAGKWNTNKGGEAYATGVGGALAGRGGHLCCTPSTKLVTLERGPVSAGSVRVGEHIQSWHGWAKVQARIEPKHLATVTVAGKLRVSTDHPIWTYTRGWQPASDLHPADILWSTTLVDTIVAHLQGVLHGVNKTWAVSDPHVQHLGTDVAALHQPESGKLRKLWRVGGGCVQAVVRLCKLLCGHGAPAVAATHAGPQGFEGRLHAGELPLGGCGDPTKQPIEQCVHRGIRRATDRGAVGPQDGANQGPDSASGFPDGYAPGAGVDSSKDEPQQARYTPVPAGWLRRAGVWLLGRCRTVVGPRGLRHGEESLVGDPQARRWAGDLCGLLLGVRFAGHTRTVHHEPTPFVNFMVSGDHTFVGDTILSHNCIVDDPLSEQDIKAGNTDSLDTTYEWYRSGLRTRLMPGGAICVLHTRWHARDLIGRLIKDAAMNPDADQYEVFEFPAILNEDDPERVKSLWPEQWSLESLLRSKASMPSWQWNAQYQQNPSARESAIIKRDWIQWWPHEDPPPCDFIIQSYDTALTTKERSDYSVCQTWGVWTNEEDNSTNLVLLNSVKGKYEFPELKTMALQQYKDWEPDSVIVETKASGQPLVDEMRRSGLFVQEFSPGKGQDKIARLNAVSDMFSAGHVWFPETQWATEVVEELLAFPNGEHDDAVDALTLALYRARQGGLLRLRTDQEDNEPFQMARRAAYY